jgi:hypothetical protein
VVLFGSDADCRNDCRPGSGYHDGVIGAVLTLAVLALVPAEQVDQLVVTTAPPLDAQRLADALRVYLDDFGIQVGTRASSQADDLRKRLDEGRALGEAVRAFAVVRVERGSPETVEIELVDLATHKALIATVPRPARDEDLYRALALKIQSILRATLSEARAELDPRSSLGRLALEASGTAPPPPSVPVRFGLDIGYGIVAFPVDNGARFDGLAVRASWRAWRWLELALGTAALGAARASDGGVSVQASVVPVHVAARARRTWGSGELLLGPCAEADVISVSATSATTPVRSSRDVALALGGEAEGRVAILTSGWLFARATALGVLNGTRYDVGGAPVVDTSRLQLAATIGVGVGLP